MSAPGFQLLVPATITVTSPNCVNVRMTPSHTEEGEPLVRYTLVGTQVTTLTLPERAVRSVPNNFLAMQLDARMADVVSTKEEESGLVVHNVELRDPVFCHDPSVFALILDYLIRRLGAAPVTLRRADIDLTDTQWAILVELERTIFTVCDLNPFWTGLTGQDFRASGSVSRKHTPNAAFHIDVNPQMLSVYGPLGFRLVVCLQDLTAPPVRPVSLLRGRLPGMEFPFPVNFRTSFFIPNEAIQCIIDDEHTVCEGILYSDGTLRIEPIDAENFLWFYFEINPRFPWSHRVMYGEEDD